MFPKVSMCVYECEFLKMVEGDYDRQCWLVIT